MALQLQLVQKQTQRLIMTPQMQQSIQLLQLNSLELEQMVDQELLENPFLDLSEEAEEETGGVGPAAASAETEAEPAASESSDGDGAEAAEPSEAGDGLGATQTDTLASPTEVAADPLDGAVDNVTPLDDHSYDNIDVNWDEVFADSESPVYTPPPDDGEENDFTEYTAAKSSLQDYLNWQLRLSSLEGRDLKIGEFLIGCVEDDGYLNDSVERIAGELGVEPADVERVLRILQTFDPPGVFARNLPECLLLQMEDLGEKTPLATAVLTEHFESLEKKRFREIARALEVDEQDVIDLFNRIRRLEPKPGRIRSKESTRYITPDVYVRDIDGDYIYSLNEGGSSRLRISKFYRDMLRDKTGAFQGKEREYAQERLRSAVMLMKNIEKRKSTILRVTEAIMEHQHEFLKKGISRLRPLTLREIAETVGMHEATISRVTSGKYVETPQGLFELKFFFSSGIESTDGGATSSRAIKDLIADLIANEDPKKPLSDEKLASLIHQKGFEIARRTVAKYREQMKILPAKLRKQTT
ncbi:MAG: RNA polymerase factor sigma-54 [Candidatus Sumerlaeota bacterium]|nr:RNA polymerase factor sigma-54 [Candidatus Sumerlaeota bacterium]